MDGGGNPSEENLKWVWGLFLILKVQEKRVPKNMKTNSRFYEIRVRKFRVGAVQDN